jgi:hypothetical protein
MQHLLSGLDETEATMESFHDCHVHGIHWRRSRFTFAMDLQYILEWIKSRDIGSGYNFLICEARLIFRSVDGLRVSMDWSGSALDAQIGVVRVLGLRPTPNGQLDRHFEIEFSDPEGTISLWSTGYEVKLLQDPVVSDVPNIPEPNGDSGSRNPNLG